MKTDVAWESRNNVGAAVAFKDGRMHWLYRTESINITDSRVGLAISEDGVHFWRLPVPVLHPDEDEFKEYEWPGRTQDGRIVQRQDSLYVYMYCAYDGKRPRQAVATSRDLVHWTKYGLAFAKAYDGNTRILPKADLS